MTLGRPSPQRETVIAFEKCRPAAWLVARAFRFGSKICRIRIYIYYYLF